MEGKRTSCSRYQPQICMLPLCSSMQRVNCWVASWQLLPQLLFCCWLCAATGICCCCCCSTGAEEEPPLKKPPMAWPIEEPTATPLW